MKKLTLLFSLVVLLIIPKQLMAALPANFSFDGGNTTFIINNVEYTNNFRDFVETYKSQIDAFVPTTGPSSTEFSAQDLLDLMALGGSAASLGPGTTGIDNDGNVISYTFVLKTAGEDFDDNANTDFFNEQLSILYSKMEGYSTSVLGVEFGAINQVTSPANTFFTSDIYGNIDSDFSRQIPIDGGLSLLALGGIAFGISRVRKKK